MSGRRASWGAPALIAGLVLAAYHNTLGNPFVFDDTVHIVENPHLRALWPPGAVLGGTARPVVAFTLALNHALGGLNPFGYHLLNLAIHALAAITLFGIVRRTLDGPRLAERFGAAATGVAFATAAIWAVHPLDTQAVTYVIQRGESLAGLFYLLTLYAVIRGAAAAGNADAPAGARAGVPAATRAFYAAAVVACALGMATKPVTASAPIVVALYDRFFLSTSWGALWRRRGALYAALAATWGVAVALAVAVPDPAVGFGLDVTPLAYAATQPGVVLHYLRLALWPSALVFDYAWPVARTAGAIVPALLAVVALLLATVWGAARRVPVAFPGVWFFLVLGPSSSFFPIEDPAFEHRMYLPLIAVVALVVTLAWTALARRGAAGARVGIVLAVLAVLALGDLTIHRNHVYASEVALWSDTVAKRPSSARAHNNLGRALTRPGDLGRAIEHLREAVRLDPGFARAYNNLGIALGDSGDADGEIASYRRAIELNPDFDEARYNLALALSERGRTEEAIAVYEEALRRRPSFAVARVGLGRLLAAVGRLDEAVAQLRLTLRGDPDFAPAHRALGMLLLLAKRPDEAVAAFRNAIRSHPDDAELHSGLAVALTQQGRLEEALAESRSAARLAPRTPMYEDALGVVFARIGQRDSAIVHFRAALRIAPAYEPARRNLERMLGPDGAPAPQSGSRP